jgi:hypothetical protein
VGHTLGRLLFLFFIALLGIILRYIILGEFEWEHIVIVSFFLVGAFFLLIFIKWRVSLDEKYIPAQSEKKLWTTRIGERHSKGRKMLYFGETKRGEYRRYYAKWWHKIIVDILEGDGQWYMNLAVKWEDEDEIRFIDQTEKVWKLNWGWKIIQDSKEIGVIKTDFSLKNSTKLKEKFCLHYNGSLYEFYSSSIGSNIKVKKGGEMVAEGGQCEFLKNRYYFDVKEKFQHHENLLVMTYLLFNYVHKQ